MRKFIISTLLAGAAFAVQPAAAAIILVDANSIQGANLLFNDGIQTGTTVTGHTQAGTLINFTGTTSVGSVIMANGGQALVTGELNLISKPANDTYPLTSLTFGIASGSFNNLEFNISRGGFDATSVVFTVIDQLGNSHILPILPLTSLPIGNGENFFGIVGTFGDSIRSVSMDFNGSAGVDAVRQIRLDEVLRTPPPAVPEPATWAMMLAGFGAVGYAMRRRRNVAVSFA